MDCGSCTKVPLGIIKISFHITLLLIVTILINFVYLKDYWKLNWEKSRCSLLTIPFASLVNSDVSVSDNFKYCLKKKTDPMIKAYTKYKLDSKAKKAIDDEQVVNKELLSTHSKVKKSEEEVKGVFATLNKIYERFLSIGEYGVHKIKNFFLKIGAIVWTIYFLVITSANTVILQITHFARTLSILNTFLLIHSAMLTLVLPPLGILLAAIVVQANIAEQVAKKRAYCCFSNSSLIKKMDETLCPIEFIKIGDTLFGNTKVTGIVRLDCPNTPMIELSDTIKITTDHLVLDKDSGKWIFSDEIKLPNKTVDSVMCLVTDNNIIPCDNYIFRDYEETSNISLQTFFSKRILESLGNNQCEIISKFEYGEKNNCLSADVLVKMKDNSFRNIVEIKKGDETSCGKVLGLYKCSGKHIKWFKIKDNIISPRIICKIESNITNNWTKTYHVGEEICANYENGYHLITCSGYFELENNVLVRDFIETRDENILNIISSKIVDSLNDNCHN